MIGESIRVYWTFKLHSAAMFARCVRCFIKEQKKRAAISEQHSNFKADCTIGARNDYLT
jgi:hypothetical protein